MKALMSKNVMTITAINGVTTKLLEDDDPEIEQVDREINAVPEATEVEMQTDPIAIASELGSKTQSRRVSVLKRNNTNRGTNQLFGEEESVQYRSSSEAEDIDDM